VEVLIRIGETILHGTLWIDTLPEEVRLALRDFVAGELPVDFIADIAHGDKTHNDAIPPSCLQSGGDSTVMDESRG